MVIDREIIAQSAQETQKLGEELGDWIRKKVNGKRQKGREESVATVICLYGELGSGKTTFAQGFAKALSVTTRLLSPTFIIVRRYQSEKLTGFLYHLDLYRAGGEKDLPGLGLPEILADSDSVVLIEWAEKLGNLLPKERIDARFSVMKEEKHSISICKIS